MKLPTIAKNSALYSIVTILQKGVSFFLLPLYTAFMTPEDYGVVNVVLSVSSFMAVLVMMALNGAATRFHYKSEDVDYRKRLWGTITTIVLINSICWGCVCYTFHQYIFDPFVGNISFYPYVALGIANTIITPLYLLFQSYLQANQEAFHYSVNTFLNFLVQMLLAIVLIAVFKMGALGMLLANVLTALLFFLYVLIAFVPKIKICVDNTVTKDSMKYSLPLLPHQFSIWGAGAIDRLLLNEIKGESATGLYSVAQQFGQVVGTLAYSVNQAFVPWFFQMLEKGEEGIKRIEKVGNCAVILYSIVAFIISLFAPELLRLMVSESFQESWQIIPFVAFAFVFHGVYFFFINILFVKDTGLVFIVTLSSMLVNIIANILLVPIWGYIGCGVACFLTYLVRALIAMIISRIKNRTIHYNYLVMFGSVFMLFVFSSIDWFFLDMSMIMSLTLKFTICIAISILFYLKYKTFIMQLVKTLK